MLTLPPRSARDLRLGTFLRLAQPELADRSRYERTVVNHEWQMSAFA
jgi:hypothetical protein